MKAIPRKRVGVAAVVTTLAVATFVSTGIRAQQAQAPKPSVNKVTEAQLDKWMQELSNWGRWGKDDVLGAANTITPEKRRQAAALVRTGETVSLSHDLVVGGEKTEFVLPFFLQMRIIPERQVVRDRQDIDPHGNGGGSHIDALCHMAYKGRFYNNFSYAESVTQEKGCRLGINNLKDGIVTRGVLIDIPRLRNLPTLAPGTHVFREDIEAWEKQAGVKVGPGDALLLRVGKPAPGARGGGGRGYDASFLPFLKDRDVGIMGGDAADVGVIPGCTNTGPVPTMCWNAVHKFVLVARGMHLFDGLDMEAVSAAAQKHKRWEFLFVAAPIRVPGGSGAPVNPLAIF
jgi:kynurenine formamidase